MERLIQQFAFSHSWKIPRHLLFWAFMYLDELLSVFGLTPPVEFPGLLAIEFVLDVVIVYLNIYFLLPKYLLKRRYTFYLVYTAMVLLAANAINSWSESAHFEYESPLSAHIGSLLFTLSVLGTAVAIKLGKYSIRQLQLKEAIQKEKISAELNYLKQQVNPHFLFNNLNSLYVQAKLKAPDLPDSIMKLSDLLRYQIYDASGRTRISFEKELSFIRNYLDLEMMRRDHLSVDWSVEGDRGRLLIAPLIYLPLIENAVKHSKTSAQDKAHISVSIHIDDPEIMFRVSNTIGERTEDHEKGGFGLDNLKRRLTLEYPGRHNLDLESKDATFTASLILMPDELPDHR